MMKTRLLSLFCIAIQACALDITPPEVVSVYPKFGEMIPDRKPTIEIRFNEAIVQATAVNAFSLTEDSGGKISGDVHVSNNILFFIPETELNGGSTFRITVAITLEDSSGNKLEAEYFSRFQTGTNINPPGVLFVSPTNQEIGIALSNTITVAFTRPMDMKSARDNIALSPQMDGQFVWNTATNILTFIPMSLLKAATHYTFTLQSDLIDNQGVRLGQDIKLYFTTGTNFFQPMVLGIYQDGDFAPFPDRFWTNRFAEGRREDAFVVCFDQPMDRLSAESAFSITPSVQGYFSWNQAPYGTGLCYQLLYHPTTPLNPGINYQAAVTSSAKGKNGLSITEDYNLDFSINTNYFVNIISISNSSNVILTNKVITTFTAVSNTVFYISFATFTNTPMDVVSVQENISVSRLFGEGNSSAGGGITGFNWVNGSRMLELDVDNIAASNVYLLSIPGGQDGINDTSGNWLVESWEVLFRVQ